MNDPDLDVSRKNIGRRALLGAAASLTFAPGIPSAQGRDSRDAADIARAEDCLDRMRTVKARFEQVAPDGSVSTGTAWIQRPGRLRFEYLPPSPFLLVAGHGLVVFYDRNLKQLSNFPIGTTPLGIVLSDSFRLSGKISVTGVSRSSGKLSVSTVRTDSPRDGSQTLVFTDPPVSLSGWTVTDARGLSTTVTLSRVETGGAFDQDMFSLVDPAFLGKEPKMYGPTAP